MDETMNLSNEELEEYREQVTKGVTIVSLCSTGLYDRPRKHLY